jgi:hypothetical protein
MPSSHHAKNDQRGGGRQMKQDMRSVRDYSIARWQKRVRFAEHDLIASGSLRFLSEKIRYPPGADPPDEEQAIANHQPAVKPVGIRSFKVQQAKAKPDGPRYALNERYRDKTASRILAAYGCDVVETPKRNPIVNPQKKNLKHLESKQNHLDFVICREMLLCHSRSLAPL